jgi:STE24 endopeptidase
MWVALAFVFVLCEAALELYLNRRQYRFVNGTSAPPDIFSKLISEEDFLKSKKYSLACTVFSFWCLILNLAPELIVMLSLRKLWAITNYFSNEILHSVCFDCLTAIIDFFVSLPCSYYKTFVIEENFGNNRSTKRLFFTDQLKALLVEVILKAVITVGLILVHRIAGAAFAIIGVAFLFILILSLQVLYPILIMPLFTTLTPLPDGDLRQSVLKLGDEAKVKIAEVYSADDSKRSSKQNAFMFGLFTRKVAVADTVMAKASVEDITAVIAHEFGHSKHNHIWKLFGIQQVSSAFVLVCLDGILKSDSIFRAFGFVSERPLIIGMALLEYLTYPVNKILQLPLNYLMRRMEFQADEFATKRGCQLDTALINLSNENMSVMEPDPWYSTFNDGHPTLFQRVVAIRKIRGKVE